MQVRVQSDHFQLKKKRKVKLIKIVWLTVLARSKSQSYQHTTPRWVLSFWILSEKNQLFWGTSRSGRDFQLLDLFLKR